MEVGGVTEAAKAGHEGYRVGTTRQGGVRAAESGRGVEAGDSGPGVELFSPSGRKVEEEESGVAGLGVKVVWRQTFTGDTKLATLDFKGIIILPVICRFVVQLNI